MEGSLDARILGGTVAVLSGDIVESSFGSSGSVSVEMKARARARAWRERDVALTLWWQENDGRFMSEMGLANVEQLMEKTLCDTSSAEIEVSRPSLFVCS